MHATVHIDTRTEIAPDLLDACWEIYQHAFAHLRATAVQRHVMTRGEFDAVMTDKRVVKYLGYYDDQLAAVATFTDDLTSMPLVSPEYFEARWPELYRKGRVYYIGFVAIEPDYQGTGVFAEIVGIMTGFVASVGGVAALDICRHNAETFRLPAAILRTAQRFDSTVTATALDEQTYWAYEFPRVDD